ncbi:uncharacterized protein [Gossypium hirsutum]|uniref:Uncharacterized protein n=1 Tax=Gossypium hirsutum TaxID=3635 RepID=A0ABM2YHS7_GOSHI|nr:uncharacterized protein LOC121203659 [Gossypium hirsutum]
MAAFKEALEYCELHDLGFSGQWYTWEKGRLVDNNIRERLDRGVANTEWWALFPSLGVLEKLKKVGSNLSNWAKKEKRRKGRRTEVLNGRLMELGASKISDAILEDITEIKLELNLEADKKELFWKQRARVNWLRMGGRNTAFFHKSATHRRRKNMINGLENEAGNLITDEFEISN